LVDLSEVDFGTVIKKKAVKEEDKEMTAEERSQKVLELMARQAELEREAIRVEEALSTQAESKDVDPKVDDDDDGNQKTSPYDEKAKR
jgi:hypothetical protein